MTDKPKRKNDSLLFPIRLFHHVWICIFPLVIVMVAVLNQMWLQLANPEPNVIAYNYWSQARDVQERLLVVIAVTVMSMVGSLYLSRRHRLRNDNFINPNASRWSRSLLITLILAVAVGGHILAGVFIRSNAHVIDTLVYTYRTYHPINAEFDARFVLTYEVVNPYDTPFIRLYECDRDINWCVVVKDNDDDYRGMLTSDEMINYDALWIERGQPYGGISVNHPSFYFVNHPSSYLSVYVYVPAYVSIPCATD